MDECIGTPFGDTGSFEIHDPVEHQQGSAAVVGGLSVVRDQQETNWVQDQQQETNWALSPCFRRLSRDELGEAPMASPEEETNVVGMWREVKTTKSVVSSCQKEETILYSDL